ncbi:MAG TPA: hypothetical protein VM142_09080 [Acidimicrobiales bacterium]|nr:hypothetical protein [Acidimicrobiales bacterium]
MTKDHDFKRLVRDRMARSGESYATARAHLRPARADLDRLDEHLQLALEGGRLNEQDAAALEARVGRDPDDGEARARLLGFYLGRAGAEDAARQAEHALWVISAAPRSRLAGSPFCQSFYPSQAEQQERAAALWLDHIDRSPDDSRLLEQAAQWFALSDRELSDALWQRVIDLEEANLNARIMRAAIYRVRGADWLDGSPHARATAMRVLEILGDQPTTADGAWLWLRPAAWAALAAGDHDKARRLARELLDLAEQREPDWNTGNAIHHGHLILGHLELLRDDIDGAERELAAAGATPGSPQLNSFGPNFSLAKGLLDRDRRDAVLAFIDACRQFWAPPERENRGAVSHCEKLDHWEDELRSGKTPNFQTQLYE